VVMPLWMVENRPFPLLWPLAYTTACTTVQAVISLPAISKIWVTYELVSFMVPGCDGQTGRQTDTTPLAWLQRATITRRLSPCEVHVISLNSRQQTDYTGCFKKIAPKRFGIFSLLSLFCVKFCTFVGNSYQICLSIFIDLF